MQQVLGVVSLSISIAFGNGCGPNLEETSDPFRDRVIYRGAERDLRKVDLNAVMEPAVSMDGGWMAHAVATRKSIVVVSKIDALTLETTAVAEFDHGNTAAGAEFCRDGSRLAILSESSTEISIWDVASKTRVHRFGPEQTKDFGISALDPTGRFFVVASGTGPSLRVFDLERKAWIARDVEGKMPPTGKPDDGTPSSIAFWGAKLVIGFSLRFPQVFSFDSRGIQYLGTFSDPSGKSRLAKFGGGPAGWTVARYQGWISGPDSKWVVAWVGSNIDVSDRAPKMPKYAQSDRNIEV